MKVKIKKEKEPSLVSGCMSLVPLCHDVPAYATCDLQVDKHKLRGLTVYTILDFLWYLTFREGKHAFFE